MRLFGQLAELVKTVMRTSSDAKNVTIIPPATLTGTSQSYQTPNHLGAGAVSDVLVSRNSTDTLTNKTLTSPIITTPVVTGLALDDTDSAFNLTLQSTSTLTADRTLTFDVDDGARVLELSGNLRNVGGNSLTLTTGGATNVTLPTTGTLATLAGTETLSNKTIAAGTIIKSGVFLEEAGGVDQLTLQVQAQTGGANANIQNLGGVSQDFVFTAQTQTLTNKTLTSPTITGATFTGATSLSLDDTDSAFNLAIASTSTLTADRTLTLDVDNGARVLELSGDLRNVGGNSLTLTTGASTNVTLPTTGTLATLAGTETLSNKTLASADATTHLRLLNQGQLKLREGTGGGTDEISIQAPATLAASYTLTLPVDDGLSGQALTTDGVGVLAWSSVATDALNQYNIKVGDVTNTAVAVNTDTTGDIQADSTAGLTINQIITNNTTQITTKTVTTGKSVTYPRMTVDSGHTWTVNSGAYLYVFDVLVLNGTLVMGGNSVVTNMGIAA